MHAVYVRKLNFNVFLQKLKDVSFIPLTDDNKLHKIHK
jgi:hypothetical protein